MIAAAANAVLDIVDDEDVPRARCASRGLSRPARARPGGARAIYAAVAVRTARPGAAAAARARLVVHATGPDTVRLLPPLTVSPDEIAEAVGASAPRSELLRRTGAPSIAVRRAAAWTPPGSHRHELAFRRRSIRLGRGLRRIPGSGRADWRAAPGAPSSRSTTGTELDARELVGVAYERVPVTVALDGRDVPAETYVVIEKEPADVPPTPPTPRRCSSAPACGLPDEYVEALAAPPGAAQAAKRWRRALALPDPRLAPITSCASAPAAAAAPATAASATPRSVSFPYECDGLPTVSTAIETRRRARRSSADLVVHGA